MVNKLLIFVIIVIAIVFVAMVYSSIGRNKQDEAIKQAAREYLLNRSSEQASTEDAKRFLLQESDLTGFTMKALYNLSGANLPILADGGAGANFESATGRIQHTVSVFDSEENASLSMRIYSGSSAGVGEESKIFNFTYYGGTFKEAKLYMRENNYVHELIVDDSERDVRADAVNYGRIIDAKDGVISYVEQPNVTKTEISDIKEAEKLALKAADLNGFTQSSYGVYPSNSYNDGRITSLLESTSNDIVYHEITLNKTEDEAKMYIESFLGNPVNLGDGGKVDTNSDDSYAILVFREGRITHKITVSLKSSGSASGDAIEYAEIADAKG